MSGMERDEIGYVLKGYPRTSETFIANEIHLLEEAGRRLVIFSLKRLEGQKRHAVVDRIKAPVIYLPEAEPMTGSRKFTWLRRNLPGFVSDHRSLFLRRPAVYLRTLVEALRMGRRYRGDRRFKWSYLKEFLQAGSIARFVLGSGRIAHLHAHFCHTTATVTMLASRLAGVPFSFTAHAKDIYREDMNPGDLLTVKLRNAQFAVTCTRANREYLDRLHPAPTPLHAIYHGIDLSLFAPERRDVERDDPPLILSVGRLVEKKGFDYLVEACALLRERGRRFQCLIVGGKDEHAAVIEALIRRLDLGGIVTLQGAVTQEQLLRIYRRAAVFALPCRVMDNGDRDGIPNVLVEAMAMELPVVSTPISGIPELIESGVNGLLVEEKNACELAAGLERLLADEELGRRLGREGRMRVAEDFDAQRNIGALNALFDALG
ncbi:MAG: glycosyltransferase family 4 protein [Acidobacteria bacterium]|nr:glycosyltransferase family 4 protein [Acidobacteriota bacterium]MCW5968980.1 glycosyltransferase family 4 protein [Blastocatellales bacterium]